MISLNADPVFLFYTVAKPGSRNMFNVPIPVYLSQKITGVYVDTDNKGLSISTDYVVGVKKDPVTGAKLRGNLVVEQAGESQNTTVNLIGRRDSVALNVLLPLFQSLYDKVISQKDYRIAYFNKNVLIFNARLASFEVNQTRENNLVSISIGLEVPPEEEKDEEGAQSVIGKKWEDVTGAANG